MLKHDISIDGARYSVESWGRPGDGTVAVKLRLVYDPTRPLMFIVFPEPWFDSRRGGFMHGEPQKYVKWIDALPSKKRK